jgi:predicted TIM-barrel fold metal-dependent hydrolase
MVWHHRFLGVGIDHPGMDPLIDRLQAHGGVAFIHIIPESGLEAPWRLEILADKHPEATFIALGGLASFQSATWIREIGKRRPNIYFDTGAVTSVGHQILDFVAALGPERLLLGTDFYCDPHLFGMPFPLVEIRDQLGLGEDAVAEILGGNAHRLLSRGGPANGETDAVPGQPSTHHAGAAEAHDA